jgi:hypothetical protein
MIKGQQKQNLICENVQEERGDEIKREGKVELVKNRKTKTAEKRKAEQESEASAAKAKAETLRSDTIKAALRLFKLPEPILPKKNVPKFRTDKMHIILPGLNDALNELGAELVLPNDPKVHRSLYDHCTRYNVFLVRSTNPVPQQFLPTCIQQPQVREGEEEAACASIEVEKHKEPTLIDLRMLNLKLKNEVQELKTTLEKLKREDLEKQRENERNPRLKLIKKM